MRPVTDLQRKLNAFEVISDYIPSGDQPKAIAELAARITAGEQDVVLQVQLELVNQRPQLG